MVHCEEDGEALLVAELDRGLLLASREAPEAPRLKLRRLDLFDALYHEVGP